MRGLDADDLAEPRDVPDPHAAAVVEVDDLRRTAEAQHVRREHAVVRRQRGDVVLPADFRADAELTAVQQNDRITLSRLQITGDQAVDQDGLALLRSRRFPRGPREGEHLGGQHVELVAAPPCRSSRLARPRSGRRS